MSARADRATRPIGAIRKRDPIGELIEAAISAPAPSDEALAPLKERLAIASVLSALGREFPPTTDGFTIPLIVLSLEKIMLYRAALYTGVITRDSKPQPVIDRDFLRANGSERSKLVLAIIGEIDWTTASEKARKAYLLRKLALFLRSAS